MHTEVATKLVVTEAAFEVSQAIGMAGANAVKVEVTLFAIGGDDVTVELQVSNDLQNWEPVGTEMTIAAVGYSGSTVSSEGYTQIAAAYVRLRYSQATSGTAVLAAGIHTANL